MSPHNPFYYALTDFIKDSTVIARFDVFHLSKTVKTFHAKGVAVFLAARLKKGWPIAVPKVLEDIAFHY